MPIVTRHSTITVAVLALIALLAAGIFLWSGVYNVAADDAHTKPVYTALKTLRDRSIAARANKLHPPPNLNDPALIRQGAGNYDAMCTACHLGPDMEETEVSKGLYPVPPNFAEMEVGDPAHQFWVIKHGIKASGMPAWGKSMEDQYIWGIVAFLQQLPKLDGEQYMALVESSEGHSHGGGETQPHDHADMTTEAKAAATSGDKPHSHPPGTPPHDDAPQTTPAQPAKPHVDPPGTPPHSHPEPTKTPEKASETSPAEHHHDH